MQILPVFSPPAQCPLNCSNAIDTPTFIFKDWPCFIVELPDNFGAILKILEIAVPVNIVDANLPPH